MSSVTTVPIRPLAKGSLVKLWLALVLLVAAAAALAWAGTRAQQVITTESGLRYRVIREGTGPTITSADLIALHYTGRLANGTVFDSSETRGQPMVTGTSGMIPGFTEALLLMKPGGSYRVWIPPHLGYGGQVPPGAPFGPADILEFDIRILEVAPGMAAAQQMQQMQQMQQRMEEGAPGAAGPEGAERPRDRGAPAGNASEAAPGRGR
jgi:FKBP-type peptidyl-prolyl cis-trans isomerase FkpA